MLDSSKGVTFYCFLRSFSQPKKFLCYKMADERLSGVLDSQKKERFFAREIKVSQRAWL